MQICIPYIKNLERGINMTANRSKTPHKLLVLSDEEAPNSPVSTSRGIRKNTTDKTKHSISPLNSAHFSPTPSDIPVLGEGGGLLEGFLDEAQTSPGSRPGSRSGSRPGSCASKSVPPSPHSGSSLRRQPTPTKQISLQAVKRKEEKDGPIPLEPDLTWNTFIRTPRSFPNTSRTSPEANNVSKSESLPNEEENIIGAHAKDSEFSSHMAASANGLTESSGQSGRPESKKGASLNKSENPENDEESSSSTEEGDVTEEEDDLIGHKGKAPNNLLMEFLTAVMEKDYQTAAKLCKMILIYEPDNKEALSFAPLIEEKMKLDEEADVNETEGGDDDEEEEDDEDDENGEEDGEDSIEDSDEDEDGDEEEEDEEEEGSDHDSQSDNDSDGPLDSGFSDGI